MEDQSNSLQHYINSVRFGVPAVSATLCVIGTLANLTSLVYFIKKKDKTIGDKLLMLLNSVDLLLCISATLLSAIFSYLKGRENTASEDLGIVMVVITVLYLLLIDGTAYVTCLLSVTRAIGIVSPFYQIRGKLFVILGISVFVVIELLQTPTFVGIRVVLLYYLLIDGTAYVTCLLSVTRAIGIVSPFYQIRGKLLVILGIIVFVVIEALQHVLFIIAIAFDEPWLAYFRPMIPLLVMLTVLCATILAVYKLTRADLQGATENVSRNNRKATWTVVILSALFLAFNSIWLGARCLLLFKSPTSIGTKTFAAFAVSLAIPLNSSINPIVYLTRMSDMRLFFIRNFQKFFHST